MSKELKACFKEIYHEIEYVYDSKISSKANKNWDNDMEHYRNLRGNVSTIERYLEAIDNANPSEALECLEEIGKTLMFTDYETLESKTLSEVMPNYYRKCKQALLKAQEQEKALDIIFKKNVNIVMLKVSENVESYNITYFDKPKWQLTEEEFDLLKRYFK